MLKHEHGIVQTLNHDTDAPCISQWALLWYVALTRMNADLVTEGRMLEKLWQGF